MKVKILKSTGKAYWYSNKIGHTFNVDNQPGENYIVQDGNERKFGLLKTDCIEVPYEWCVKVGDDSNYYRSHSVIKYLNKKFNCEFNGGVTYYGIKNNLPHNNFSHEGPFGKLLTLEEFELIFLDKKIEEVTTNNKDMKKVIGYKLNGKVTAQQVASLIDCSPDIYPNGCFLLYPQHFDIAGNNICKGAGNKLKELGVLDAWFTPVYEESTKTIVSGDQRIEIKITPGSKIEAAGREVKIELLKEIHEDMVDNIFHENTTDWKITFPAVKIGCSTFTAQEIKQIIDIYNGK